jgi:hypothetical protein
VSAKGYVALHRDIRNHPRYREKYWFRVWAEMEMSAAHTGFKKVFKGQAIDVKPGQLITDRVSFGEELKIEPDEVERVWHRMRRDGEITWEASNKKRLITILDWNVRQMRVRCVASDTPKFIGKSSASDTPNAQQTHSHPVVQNKGNNGKKDTFLQKDSLPSEGHTPPAIANRSSLVFEEGYVFRDKFIPSNEANELAKQNHELLFEARPAIRHQDGRIEQSK